MNPTALLLWFVCMFAALMLAAFVAHILGLRDAHGRAPEERAIQAITNQATNSDLAAKEQMRRDCIQQVRNAWGAGEISQDAYQSISGYIRNLE